LNIINGTPEGVPLDVSRATLPINQLKSTVIFDDHSKLLRWSKTTYEVSSEGGFQPTLPIQMFIGVKYPVIARELAF